MRILIVSDLYLPHIGGVTRFIQKVSNLLIKKGHTVGLVVPSKKMIPTVENVNGVKIYSVKSVPAIFYSDFYFATPNQKKLVAKIMEDFKPDVVHIHTNMLLAFIAKQEAKRMRIPLVATNHFMSENILPKLLLPKFVKKRLDSYMWRVLIKFFSDFNTVTSPSHWGAKYLTRKGVQTKIKAISNGIDLKIYKKIKINNNKYLTKKYNLPKKGQTLLFVGRIDKEKNIEEILKSFKYIKGVKNVNLVIVGIGSRTKYLKRMANKLGLTQKVYFTNFVEDEDLPKLYNFADIFIISSTAELQSIATLEAMASGLPVIAADAGALPEIVVHNKNGSLFPPTDSEKMASEITKIMLNPKLKKQMGLQSLKIAKQHDVNKIATEFENLYKQVVGSSKKTTNKTRKN